MKTEPLVTVASITAILGALLVLLREFGVPLTDGQHDAIVGFALVVAPLIVAAVVRGKVTPTKES